MKQLSEQSAVSNDISMQLENLRSGIRETSHDINNLIGAVRMAVYFLDVGTTDSTPHAKYFQMIGTSLTRIEGNLRRLKALRENPCLSIHEIQDPIEP